MTSEEANMTIQSGVVDIGAYEAGRAERGGIRSARPAPVYARREIIGRDGEVHQFTGALLGHGTSHRDHHNHYPRRFAQRGEKCSACRWFEVAIYRRTTAHDDPTGVTLGHDYVIHTVGWSVIPGEQRLSRVQFTSSAFEIIEMLTVRHQDKEPFIAVQSARALAQAAGVDQAVRDAYINRAVV
jgi:hypothetical protein